jgi:hypothetical protein
LALAVELIWEEEVMWDRERWQTLGYLLFFTDSRGTHCCCRGSAL